MKKIIFLSLFAIISLTAWADTVYRDSKGYIYSLNNENLTASITGRHVSGDTIIVPDSVHYGGKSYVINELCTNAFSQCVKLVAITIPNTVTKIGEGAFYGCENLSSITIPNTVTTVGKLAFYRCASLNSITIPNTVTTIGEGAFSYCEKLSSITIPNSVISFGYGLLESCSSLTCVTLPNSIKAIPPGFFKDCPSLSTVNLPDSITSIGYDAFQGCTALTSFNIPNGVTSIGSRAFQSCIKLDSIIIPNSVTIIGNNAFDGCKKLTSVIIPDSLTKIASFAFAFCYNLTSVTIPKSLKSIEKYAFTGCNLLKRVNISDLGAWCKIDYENSQSNPLCSYASLFLNGEEIVDLAIPEEIDSIKQYAFFDNIGLKTVHIHSSIKNICTQAFYGCTNLKKVYNNSPLRILIGNSDFGDVAYYADKVYYGGLADTTIDTTVYRYTFTIGFMPDSFKVDIWKPMYFSPVNGINTIFYTGNNQLLKNDFYNYPGGGGVSGKPLIPLFDSSIILPSDAQFVEGIEIHILERKLLAQNIRFPSGGGLPFVGSKKFSVNTDSDSLGVAYKDTIYNEYVKTKSRVRSLGKSSGVNYLLIALCPFYVEGFNKAVYVSKMELSVLYTKDKSVWDPANSSATRIKESVNSFALNSSDFETFYPSHPTGIISPYAAAIASSIIACSEGGVRCQIGSEVKKATLTFCTISGQTVSQMEVGSRGEVVVVPSTSEWHPGTYLCILRTDGQKADAKKFVIR